MRLILLFFFIMFVIGTDTFLISPLLPALREAFGVSTSASGWLVSAYALGYAMAAPVIGPLSDGWNRKKTLTVGMLLFAVSTFLCGVAGSFIQMFVFRLLAGVSAAVASPQVWASIPSVLPPSAAPRAMGIAAGGLSVAQLLGLPLGSWLARHDLGLPFTVVALSSLVLAFLVWLWLADQPPAAEQPGASAVLDRYRELLRHPGAKRAFFGYFAYMTGGFAAFSFIGAWLADRWHAGLETIGTSMLFMGMGNAVGSFTSGYWLQRFGRGRLIAYGLSIAALSFVLMPHAPTPAVADVSLFISYVITGMLFPVLMGLLQTLSARVRGTIASLANTTMYLATVTGTTAAGLLYEHGGFALVGGLSMTAFLLSLVSFAASGLLQPALALAARAKEERH